MKLRSNGELESSLSSGPKALTAESPPSTGPPPRGGGRVYDPTQAWLRRERRRLHTHGIGGGGQQLRPRHLALLDRYVPAWDSKWQRMLTACRKYLRTKGKLPRDGPKQVAAMCGHGAGSGATRFKRQPSLQSAMRSDRPAAIEGAPGCSGGDGHTGAHKDAGKEVAKVPAVMGAASDDSTMTQDRVSALAGWLTKQQQQLVELTLSQERVRPKGDAVA